MKVDPKYIVSMDTSKGPTSPQEQKDLETKMGFKYRAAIGELIFIMITYQSDIYTVIKLTKFNNAPKETHCNAVLDIYRILDSKMTDSMFYWRPEKIFYLIFHQQN